jgi:four helix bundle protein
MRWTNSDEPQPPVALNIAEGGKHGRDRMRFYEIARGSTLECVAALSVLQLQRALSLDAHEAGHAFCERLYAMLTRMVR